MSDNFKNEMLDLLLDQLVQEKRFEVKPAAGLSYEDVERGVISLYSKYFDSEYISQRFAIPEDYALYLKKKIYMVQGDYWTCIDNGQSVLDGTRYFLEIYEEGFFERKSKGKTYTTDVIWLEIGFWSDKHFFMLCCDKGHPDYGKVFDVHDDHPWAGEDFLVQTKYDSFLALLEDYLPKKEEDYL